MTIFIDDVLQSVYTAIITNIQKTLRKSSGWIIDSIIDHTISISKKNLLAGSSYIKSSKELDHPRKGLINIQNINDNGFFKWSIVRFLNPTDHNPRSITKADKDFTKKNDFKEIKFPVKTKDIHKTAKQNSISISVSGYENKEKYPIYVSKKCREEKYVDLLLTGEEGERHYYVLIKDLNTFMYDHTLHYRRKHFCCYCLQAFSTEEILKRPL